MKRYIVAFLFVALAAGPALSDETASSQSAITLEDIAQKAVEQVLTYFLQAKTTVGAVSWDNDAQALKVEDLKIANPKGFSSTPVIVAEQAMIEADPKTLLGREPAIRSVKLKGAAVNAEQNFSRGLNIKKLMDSVGRFNKGSLLPKGKPKQWAIGKAVIEDCAVRFSAPLIGQGPYERTIDNLEMELGGANGQGLTTQEVLSKVLDRFMQESQPGLFDNKEVVSTEKSTQSSKTQSLEKLVDLLKAVKK